MEKIVIGRDAFDKIMYYVKKAKFEISGFGNVAIVDGIPTVTDIILLKQENNPTETEMDGDAVAKALYDHHVSGMKGELKFWWHSHVDMPTFWSKTDMDTIDDLTKNGWFIHGVFNKKDEYRLAYSSNEPFGIFVDDIKLDIDENLVSDELYSLQMELDILKGNLEKNCDDKFDELVTDKEYSTYYKGWFDYKGGNSGKNLASYLTATKSLATSKTLSIGQENTTGYSDYYINSDHLDPQGALELFTLGYTEKEIEYMQDTLQVFDELDVISFETAWGPIQKELDLEFKNTINK